MLFRPEYRRCFQHHFDQHRTDVPRSWIGSTNFRIESILRTHGLGCAVRRMIRIRSNFRRLSCSQIPRHRQNPPSHRSRLAGALIGPTICPRKGNPNPSPIRHRRADTAGRNTGRRSTVRRMAILVARPRSGCVHANRNHYSRP